MRRSFALFLLAPLAVLAACGGQKEAGNQVQMRDMEVVDGTISDGMTDLDAARADGTALLPGSDNMSAAAPAQPRKPAAENQSAPSEAVTQQ